jgi:hypothetical protein
MVEPRAWAEQAENHPVLPDANAERLAGYGVMGLPFATGHVLALRRFPASSVGRGFTSVWHRSPEGDWTFYADVAPAQSCPRYFQGGSARTVLAPIHLAWRSDRALAVTIGDDAWLDWEITLAATPVTRLLSTLGGVMPEVAWQSCGVLAVMGRLAGPLLGAGRVRLHGRTPNHQWFLVNPLRIWSVQSSRARLGGRDLGAPAPLPDQARLADFWVPQRGLFALGRAFFEPFDAARHLAPTSEATPATGPRARA